MRIAFTSCMDVLDDPKQKIWGRIADKNPQVLLLLGDNIYMDFGFLGPRRLKEPKKWDNAHFAEEMYRRYKKQSEVSSFRQFLAGIDHVGTTWDDHDFAWNNTAGLGGGEGINEDNVVPRKKKLISRALHLQYRDWLRSRPLPIAYPPMPDLDTMLHDDDQGIQESFDLDTVRVVMLDTRYHREPTRRFFRPKTPTSNLLGDEQRQWLKSQIDSWSGVTLLGSSSTLLGKEGWDNYQDFEWLQQRNLNHCLFLTGDIHKWKLPDPHINLSGVTEATASGAARPSLLHGNSEVYGILDIEGDTVTIDLYGNRKFIFISTGKEEVKEHKVVSL